MYKGILVTGAFGFVGSTLVPALRQAFPDARVTALGHEQESPAAYDSVVCDITDGEAVRQLIQRVEPDCVINLAAISHIPTSFDQPQLTWRVNLNGTLNLLQALTELNLPVTFLQVGSADSYGRSFVGGEPLDEMAPFQPLNPYAASKAAADIAAFSYVGRGKLKVIRARPFNHTAAGQSNQFVVSAFAEQIARIEAGLQEPVVQVGNLDAKRCFLHLDDVVQAYVALLRHAEKIESGDAFNIVASEPVTIAFVLESLIRLSSKSIQVQQDPDRMRPTDIPVAMGTAQHLQAVTGWRAEHDLNDILVDVLSAWRKHYSV
jgi:GDP-4-dehydro-6-deoxy-D-mannose reductase